MQKLKQSRVASFIVIAAVYVLASLCGVLTYLMLPFNWVINLLIADAAATALTFVFGLIFSNASVYDPYWSVQPIVIVLAFAVGKEMNLLRLLLVFAICFWGVRLTANWAYTFSGLTHQDWRYTMLKEKTGIFYPFINFTGIHMLPTLIVYACVLPAVYAFQNDISANAGSVIAILVSFLAALMQCVADIQMQRFRKAKDGVFIHTGLWKYSRHPNYLGEILMWWGIAVGVLNAAHGELWLLSGAIANTLLFLVVSIPMADKRQSEKEGYEQYKKKTRMLLPIKK